MKLKQLLKPNWRKAVLFLIIGAIANLFSLFPLYGPYCVGGVCTLCCFWRLGTFVKSVNSSYPIVYIALIGELFIFYLISCFSLELYDKIRKRNK